MSSAIDNSVVINSELNGDSAVNRVVGSKDTNSILINNYAIDTMKVNGMRRTSYDVL
jgi:hypothetical protein